MLDRAAVVESVNEVQQRVRAWESAEEQGPLTPEIVDAIKQLAQQTHTMDVDEDAFTLVMAVDAFVIEVERWLNQRAINPEMARIYGSEVMWKLWQEVLKAREPFRKRLPPPVRVLRDQKCSSALICRKYRFIDDRGRPDMHKLDEHTVCENRGEPSPHYDPKTFLSASDERRLEQVREQWQGRAERLGKFGVVLSPSRVSPSARRSPPEPIEVLARYKGMTLDQIARMHRISVQEVRDYLDEHNYTYDPTQEKWIAWESPLQQSRVQRQDTEVDAMLNGRDPHEELGDDLDARILAVSEDGNSPAMVARILTYHLARVGEPAVTYQQVQSVLESLRSPTEDVGKREGRKGAKKAVEALS